jgi:hypothetical protein
MEGWACVEAVAGRSAQPCRRCPMDGRDHSHSRAPQGRELPGHRPLLPMVVDLASSRSVAALARTGMALSVDLGRRNRRQWSAERLPYPQEALQGCRGVRLRARRGFLAVRRSQQPLSGHSLRAKDPRPAYARLSAMSAASTAKLRAVSRRRKEQTYLSSTFSLLNVHSARGTGCAARAFWRRLQSRSRYAIRMDRRSSATKRARTHAG